MAKTARGNFIRAMVFLQLTIIFVVSAISLWPAAKTCSLADLLGSFTDIFGMLFSFIGPYLISVLFIIHAIIFGLLFFTHFKRSFSLWRANRPGPKFKFGFKEATFLLIFIISFMPFFLPLIDRGKNFKPNSIYNFEYNGSSKLRNFLNTSSADSIEGFSKNGLDYNVEGIESSLSTMMRNNNTYKILVLLGPNRIYNPATELPFFIDFLNTGGSILIADDKGSTNWFVMELSLYSLFKVPFIEFPKGDLADNGSFIPGATPYFPVIKNFAPSHPITNYPNDIITPNLGVALNHASAILAYEDVIASLLNNTGGGSITTVGSSTDSLSFIDRNNDTYFDPKVDVWDPSFVMDFLMSLMCMVPEEDKAALINYASEKLLGHEPKVVFATSELALGRIFFSGDASFLNNQLIDDPNYSNAEFAENIFEWLSFNQNHDNVTIYFDEYHIRQEGFEEFSSSYIYGIFIGYVNWLSSSAILAWIYPFLALWTLSKWLPKDPEKVAKATAKKEEKAKKGEDDQEFRIKFGSETAFVKKIKKLREGSDFNEPVLMLYRRVLRRLNRLLGEKEPTTDNLISLIRNASKKEITANDDTRLRKFFNTMNELKAKTGRKIGSEDEFKDLFFEMTWVADWLNLNIV